MLLHLTYLVLWKKLQSVLNFGQNDSWKSTGNHICWSVRHRVVSAVNVLILCQQHTHVWSGLAALSTTGVLTCTGVYRCVVPHIVHLSVCLSLAHCTLCVQVVSSVWRSTFTATWLDCRSSTTRRRTTTSSAAWTSVRRSWTWRPSTPRTTPYVTRTDDDVSLSLVTSADRLTLAVSWAVNLCGWRR